MADQDEIKMNKTAVNESEAAQVAGGGVYVVTKPDYVCEKSPTGRHVYVILNETYSDGTPYTRRACQYCDRNDLEYFSPIGF